MEKPTRRILREFWRYDLRVNFRRCVCAGRTGFGPRPSGTSVKLQRISPGTTAIVDPSIVPISLGCGSPRRTRQQHLPASSTPPMLKSTHPGRGNKPAGGRLLNITSGASNNRHQQTPRRRPKHCLPVPDSRSAYFAGKRLKRTENPSQTGSIDQPGRGRSFCAGRL